MSAADIVQYDMPFIQALAPVIFVIAIIANARLLTEFILSIFDRTGEE